MKLLQFPKYEIVVERVSLKNIGISVNLCCMQLTRGTQFNSIDISDFAIDILANYK